jgi:(1->4)-alpha-D-glucan 1-alpha-D-glucosylmutase
MNDGRIKMFLTWKALMLRRQHASLFQKGEYLPLSVHGANAGHVIAFARRQKDASAIVVVPRLCAQLLKDTSASVLDPAIWKDTWVQFVGSGSHPYRSAFTLETVVPREGDGSIFFEVSMLLEDFPVALLIEQNSSTRN